MVAKVATATAETANAEAMRVAEESVGASVGSTIGLVGDVLGDGVEPIEGAGVVPIEGAGVVTPGISVGSAVGEGVPAKHSAGGFSRGVMPIGFSIPV